MPRADGGPFGEHIEFPPKSKVRVLWNGNTNWLKIPILVLCKNKYYQDG